MLAQTKAIKKFYPLFQKRARVRGEQPCVSVSFILALYYRPLVKVSIVKLSIVKLSIVLLGIVLYISPARGAGGGCILCRGCLHVVQGVYAYRSGGSVK